MLYLLTKIMTTKQPYPTPRAKIGDTVIWIHKNKDGETNYHMNKIYTAECSFGGDWEFSHVVPSDTYKPYDIENTSIVENLTTGGKLVGDIWVASNAPGSKREILVKYLEPFIYDRGYKENGEEFVTFWDKQPRSCLPPVELTEKEMEELISPYRVIWDEERDRYVVVGEEALWGDRSKCVTLTQKLLSLWHYGKI